MKKFLLVCCASICAVSLMSQSYVPEVSNRKISVKPSGALKAYAFDFKNYSS
jgi:hypothetical protein